jgi:hypothetical protein
VSCWAFVLLMTFAGIGLGAIMRDQYIHRRAQRLVAKLKFEQLKAKCPNCYHYDKPCDLHKERLR